VFCLINTSHSLIGSSPRAFSSFSVSPSHSRGRSGRFIARTPTLSPQLTSPSELPLEPFALSFLHPLLSRTLIPHSCAVAITRTHPIKKKVTPLYEEMADLPHTPPATQDPAVPQSIPSSISAPIVLTADALQVLLAHVARNLPTGASVQTTASPAVPLPQANLPPFHSTSATVVAPGESLYDLFPLIETSTILDITKHIFKPLDLFKLDPTLHDKNTDLKLDFDNGTISAKAHSGSLRDYPRFSSLVEPLTIYFDILSAYAASSGNVAATYAIVTGGFHYIRHLSTLIRSYHWHAVLQYHKAFFMLRCRDMLRGDYTGWARSDVQLMNCHLYHQVRSSAVNSSEPSRVASSSSSQTSHLFPPLHHHLPSLRRPRYSIRSTIFPLQTLLES
jgi:hypothetical protein